MERDELIENENVHFIVRIALTVVMLSVYGSITYVSIKGLASFVPEAGGIIYIFGGGFEAGKLVVLIYIHRRWSSFNLLKQGYYTLVSVVLVSLTLVGMYLFITDSYSKSNVDMRSIQSELSGLKTEREFLQKQIRSVDSDLKGLPSNHVKDRFKNKKSSGYQKKEERISEILKRETELNKEKVKIEKGHLKTDKNSFENLYILVLVIAYEMLSIGLIFATSDVWQKSAETVKRPKKGSADMKKRPESYQENASDIGRKPAEIKLAETGRNVERPVNVGSADLPEPNKTKTAENRPEKKPEQIGQKSANNNGQYLRSFQKEYSLSARKIAEITDRKKIETVEKWLKYPDTIPLKSVSKLKNWHSGQKLKLVKKG